MIHIFISTTVKTTLIRRHREEKQTRDIIRTYPTRNKTKPKADSSVDSARDGPWRRSVNKSGLKGPCEIDGVRLGHVQDDTWTR